MHSGSQRFILYADMKHITIVGFHTPKLDVGECINSRKYVLNRKLTMTLLFTLTDINILHVPHNKDITKLYHITWLLSLTCFNNVEMISENICSFLN